MRRIDLNCDLGEGAGHDAELMPLVTSANIACGAHAGDPATIAATVELAKRHGVGIGAHPGFADPANFGRLEQAIDGAAAVELVLEQVDRLHGIAGPALRHVKLHGALYNQVAREPGLAEAVALGLVRHWPRLVVFALAGSVFARRARDCGLAVAEEVFADRRYRRDGSLVPRDQPGAVIAEADEAVAQALAIVARGSAACAEGGAVSLRADTLCLHGDGADAVEFARRLRRALTSAGVTVQQCGAG